MSELGSSVPIPALKYLSPLTVVAESEIMNPTSFGLSLSSTTKFPSSSVLIEFAWTEPEAERFHNEIPEEFPAPKIFKFLVLLPEVL